jgi:hypothetical protein
MGAFSERVHGIQLGVWTESGLLLPNRCPINACKAPSEARQLGSRIREQSARLEAGLRERCLSSVPTVSGRVDRAPALAEIVSVNARVGRTSVARCHRVIY